MNWSRRSGEVPSLDLNIIVHWCTPFESGMRHGHRMSGYSTIRFSISAFERALIDDLFADIFLVFCFLVSIFLQLSYSLFLDFQSVVFFFVPPGDQFMDQVFRYLNQSTSMVLTQFFVFDS